MQHMKNVRMRTNSAQSQMAVKQIQTTRAP